MKVLVAIPCLLLGGTEYQTLNLVKALRECEYDVQVLCYFEYDDRMVSYMREAGAEVELMCPDGTRPIGLWATIRALVTGIRKGLKSYHPDVVHVQYLAPGALPIIVFKLLGVKKILATAHVPGHIYKRKWIPQLVANYMTDLFLCVSKSSEQAFFETEPRLYTSGLLKSGRKHCTLYNCVEVPESYHVPLRSENSPCTIGIVSRLSYEKGIDRLMNAMPAILSKSSNAKLLIVGDGAHKAPLMNLAKELNINEAIIWAGLQPKEALQGYYSQMDIVVIPSRFEAFGLTAIEAMSYGIPVVASRVDGLMEIIENDLSGILVDSSNPTELASVILSLIDDRKKSAFVGEDGYKRVKATFAYNIYQKTIANMYAELLEGNCK